MVNVKQGLRMAILVKEDDLLESSSTQESPSTLEDSIMTFSNNGENTWPRKKYAGNPCRACGGSWSIHLHTSSFTCFLKFLSHLHEKVLISDEDGSFL